MGEFSRAFLNPGLGVWGKRWWFLYVGGLELCGVKFGGKALRFRGRTGRKAATC